MWAELVLFFLESMLLDKTTSREWGYFYLSLAAKNVNLRLVTFELLSDKNLVLRKVFFPKSSFTCASALLLLLPCRFGGMWA